MDRCQLLFALLLPLLFSAGHGALTFRDVWNLALPRSMSPAAAETAPDHLPHADQARSLPTAEEGDGSQADEVFEHSKTRVDFGTKAWPYIYYARRDREGTVDWGTKSWPYIFYSKKEDGKDDKGASSDSGGGAVAHHGRKAGGGFRI